MYAILSKNSQVGTYISGAVTEAVAALFFTQSNQARALMARFFDRLRDDRRLEESLALATGIEDSVLRSSLQALLSMHLIGSQLPPDILPGFTSASTAAAPLSQPPARAEDSNDPVA